MSSASPSDSGLHRMANGALMASLPKNVSPHPSGWRSLKRAMCMGMKYWSSTTPWVSRNSSLEGET